MRKKYRALFAATAALFVHGQAARATDYFSTWNASAASWSNAANWLNTPANAVYPNNGDDSGDGNTYEVTVNGTGTNTTQLTLSENITVSSLAFSNADLLGGSSSGSGYSVSVLGAFNDSASGTFELQSGANLDLSGASTIASGTISGDTNSAINNLSGGTFTVSGSGETAIAIPLNNNGQVSVSSGTLSLQGGGSGSGNFKVASGATLEVASTNYYTGSPTYLTAGNVANDGLLNLVRLSTATFGTISGTGSISVPGAPTTLNINQFTQNAMSVDGGTINFLSATASTVSNLTLTANSGSPVFTGTASDNTTIPSTAASLTVTGLFNASANFTLNKGFVLNLAGTGSFSGNNIDGGTNAQINILPGAVIQHNSSNTTYLDYALTTVAGEVDVNTGTFIIDYGGTHSGTFNVSSGASAQVGGAFTSASHVTTAGSFVFIPSAGADSDPALPGYTGHNFNGTLNVQAGGSLGFKDIGLPGGLTFITNQSTVTMDPSSTLDVEGGGGVFFNNQQALTIGAATFNGGAIFRNPGLSITTANLTGPAPTNVKFENTGTVTIGTLNQSGIILRTGQEDNLPTTVSVGTFNFSAGEESGLVSVTGAMNWTGGVIDADYGHVIIQPGATLSISGTGGTISQSGKLDVHGNTYSANNLTDSGETANSLLNFYSATTTINGNLSAANTGTVTSGANTASVTINVAAPATLNVSKLVLLGNANGGDAELKTAGTVTASGLSLNDVTVTAGTVTVSTDTNSADNIDPVVNGSIVGGYERDGQLNVNGGTVTAPYMKLGVTGGNTGTFTQTAGSVTLGILGAGNSGTLTSGSGVGMATVSGGTLYTNTLLLGSTAGGSGEMVVSGTGNVTVGGGAHPNDLIIDGGTFTVLNQDPPAGEDPELNRAIAAGYLTNGALTVNGGDVTSPMIKLGVTANETGTFTQSAGIVNVTVFGIGNDASLTSGSGIGMAAVSGGTLMVDTLLLGSNAGGSGQLIVSGTADVIVAGGAHPNDLVVNSGSFTVLDQDPPADEVPPEDPELNRAIAAGYLTNGLLSVNGTGLVTTPYIKLGITSGFTGTFAQTGGTTNVGTLCVGNDVTTASGSGVGSVTLSGGAVSIGTLLVGSTAATPGVGTVAISGTAAVRITNSLTLIAGQSGLSMSGGTLTLDAAPASLASDAIPIGDGTTPTMLHLHNTALTGSGASLTIAAHATLDGGGGDQPGETIGLVSFAGTNVTFSGSNATLHMAIGQSTFDQITESNGTFTVGGATLQLLPASNTMLNTPYPIIVTGTGGTLKYTSQFVLSTDPSYEGTVQYSVSYTPTAIDVTFTSVPEPTAASAIFAGAGLLGRRRRTTDSMHRGAGAKPKRKK